MTDPFAGRRIFVTSWPNLPTAASPPAVIAVPERNETDLSEIVDTIGPLTTSERAGLRDAILADASKRASTTLAELNGTPWNKWCYLTALRYGPAFAAEGVFTDAELEELVKMFVGRAHNSGWNVREAEAGIRNGLRAATDTSNNFSLRELTKIRNTTAAVAMATSMAAPMDPAGAGSAQASVASKTAMQLIMERDMEKTNKVKVLWDFDAHHTLLHAGFAFAVTMRDRVFASSVSGSLSAVDIVNGRDTEEVFLTADDVRDRLLRSCLFLEPVLYIPAHGEEGATASEKVPRKVALIKTVVGRSKGEQKAVMAWTCEGVADAFNAKAVLTTDAAGKPAHDPETTVWLPVEKMDATAVKLAVERIMALRGGLVMQDLLGVFRGPQMFPNGAIVAETGLHTARGATGTVGHEVAFVEVGDLAGMLEVMPVDRAKEVVRRFIDLFPYAEPEDGAVLAAMTASVFCRLAFTLSPLTLIDAPIFGAGKTFAAERIAGLNGTAPVAIACTNKSRDSGDEMRKRIETECITGQAGIKILDDVPGGELPNVESFRTMLSANSAKCTIRVLGENRSVVASPAKFTWVATGNNMKVSEDMVRRSVHARLDRDKAEARGWAGEAKARVALDRIKDDPKACAEVVSAILTLLQHVRQVGATLPPLSNFAGWSALPREVAALVMGADPVATQARLRANDEKAIEHAEVVAALLELIGEAADVRTPHGTYKNAGGFMLARDIAARISGTGAGGPSFALPAAAVPDYIQDLRHVFDGDTGPALERRVLAWLRQHKDRRTAPDEQGMSYAVVCRKMRDPKQRKERDHYGVMVHSKAVLPWQRAAE
ncbi:hypothetical protein ML401_20670 [Bradyrhizobium sp. 62B]|nr:hypothetical protein ML401_20670 [Bradyrhizobium sp. 62B]